MVLILLYMSGICGSPSEFTLGKWSWSCCTRQEYAAHHLSSLVKSGSRLTIWVLVFLLGLPSEVLSRLQDAGGESQMSKEPCHHRKLDQHHVMPSSIASPTFAQITRWVANRRSPEDFKWSIWSLPVILQASSASVKPQRLCAGGPWGLWTLSLEGLVNFHSCEALRL